MEIHETFSTDNHLIEFEFGASGHEDEWILTKHKNKFTEAEELPGEWEKEISQRLGKGWSVMDRGGYRIEIRPPNSKIDEEQKKILEKTIEEVTGATLKKSE